VEELLSMGAKEYLPITKRGDSGFVTAAVVDPFGNIVAGYPCPTVEEQPVVGATVRP
jgi:hypothetical protein